MQEADAERRIQLLRSIAPSASTEKAHDEPVELPSLDAAAPRSSRKRRRLAGENDTDRDIRLAREDVAASALEELPLLKRPASDAPLADRNGHISLFPEEKEKGAPSRLAGKNAEAEAEKARKTKEFEDQYTMRFSNAAGYRKDLSTPWYASLVGGKQQGEERQPRNDIDSHQWGDGDRRRQERQQAKREEDDPLASIKKGVRMLKKAEGERNEFIREQKAAISQLDKSETEGRHGRRKRHRRPREEDDLDSFSLGPPAISRTDTQPGDEHHRRRHHRHREKKDHSSSRHKSRHSRGS
jgi:hypothetical protein